MLLAAFGNRRPTRDVDLAALDVSNEVDNILGLIREVLTVPAADGLEFQLDSLTGEVIREDSEYSGIRVSAKATLSRAKLSFHVDVNVGDPIYPAPTTVAVPRLLTGDPIVVRGYPLHMVYAEKIVTAVQRGTASIRVVAESRQATIIPLAEALDGYPAIGQKKWAAWRRRTDNDSLPEELSEVISVVATFGDPALSGLVTDQVWDHHRCSWSTEP